MRVVNPGTDIDDEIVWILLLDSSGRCLTLGAKVSTNDFMSRNPVSAKAILLVSVLFVSIIVLTRVMPHLPNFTPVAAAALFLAFAFGRKIGIMVVGLGMVLTDLFFAGGYNFGVMLSVYVALSLPAVFGPFLNRQYHLNDQLSSWKRGLLRALQIGGLAATGTILFFLVTNLAVWAFMPTYEASIEGLLTCYAMALPFFKNALMGDLFYNGVFFGVYYLLRFASDDTPDRKWEDRLRWIPVRKDK